MKPLGESVVVTVDTSISLRERDYKPSRIDVARNVVRRLVSALLERPVPTLVGIIGFYMWGYPILSLTDDYDLALEAVEDIRIMGEATAPGDAIEKAVLMLISLSPAGYSYRVIMVTDGTFNEGVPPDLVAKYAARCGVTIDVLSFGNLTSYDKEMIKRVTSFTGGEWVYGRNEAELLAYAVHLASKVAPYKRRSPAARGWQAAGRSFGW